MKNPQKLQNKLIALLKGKRFKLQLSEDRQWNEIELREAAAIVQDYVNSSRNVVESDDPLREWLDEYRFYLADSKVR